MKTYTLRFLGPGLPLGFGVPSGSVVAAGVGAGAERFDPGLGPGILLRLDSLFVFASPSSLVVGGSFDLSPFSSVEVLEDFGVSKADACDGFDFDDDLGSVLGSESSYGNCVSK